MLHAVVVQLRDLQDHAVITEPLQMDASSDVAALGAYLNTILEKDSAYLFYYCGDRITASVADTMEKHGLGSENTIVIDYVDIKDQKEDSEVQVDDVVVELAVYGDKLYAVLYNGALLDVHGAREICCGVTSAVGGSDLFFATGCEVKRAHEVDGSLAVAEEPVWTFGGFVHALVASGEALVAGSEKKQIQLISAEKRELLYTEDTFRALSLAGSALLWVESLDVVVRHSLTNGKRRTYFTKHPVTAVAAAGDTVYAATSDGVLLVLGDGETRSQPVGLRCVDRILVHGNTLLLASQNAVISVDANTLSERACFYFDEQINAIAIAADMLYVANGCKIAGYKLERFGVC
ncbi:hypothetical protein PAPHI01_0898 [Pancytospora philotis]|nr:hypothetical protein PAPHI01_0898 [Pancytospora philotis]